MKVILVQTGFLGDVILSTPVISGLRMILPKAEITVLTTPAARPLLEHHPELFEVLEYDKRGKDRGIRGLKKMAAELRLKNFSLAVCLHKSYRTALLLSLAKIPRRIGFRESALWWTYTSTTRRRHFPHDVLRNLVILEQLGARLEDLPKEMRVYPGESSRKEADELLQGHLTRPLIGIAPGSVWATKRWTADGFVELSRMLIEDGFSVVIIGGPDDSELGNRLKEECGDFVLDLTGKCSLATSSAIIEKLEVIVTNDSSPLHMASAVGTPVVAIFCATIPEFGYGPWLVKNEIVQVSGLSCRPCGRHGGDTCPTGTHACRLGISASAVRDAAFRVAGEHPRLRVQAP